jgi:hypothetical protein
MGGRFRLGVVIGALCCGAVAVDACGGSGDGGGASPTEAGATETAPPPPPTDAGDASSPVLPMVGPVNEQVVGGTRIRPKLVETADGARGFVAWHDTLLDADCSWRTASDGLLRCLPTTGRLYYDWDRQFTDGTCTTPILVDARQGNADGCGPGKYFSSVDETACPGKTRVESVGGMLTPATYGYANRSQPCTSQSFPAGDKAYALGPEVAAAQFVAGVVSYGDVKDGVAAAYVTGEDGSKGYLTLVDTLHDSEPCGFARSADGTIRCLPLNSRDGVEWGIVWEDLFTDATCTSYWAQLEYYSKCPTKYGWRYDDRGSCNPKFFVHPVLAPTTVPLYRDAGTCNPQGQTGAGGFTTGPEVPVSTFSTVDAGPMAPFSATTRLERFTSVTSGGLVVATGWYDIQRKEACSFLPDSAGTLRCMPGGPLAGAFYADAACTKPVYPVYACGPGPVTPPAHVMQIDRSACPARYRVFATGAQHVGTIYEKYATGPCTMSTLSQTTYEQGAEISPSDLQDAAELVP